MRTIRCAGDGVGWYLTEYTCDGSLYGGGLWARNWSHARAVARRRGLGEKVIGGPKRSQSFAKVSTLIRKRKRDPTKIFHGACYLAWLALSSKAASSDDLLSDTGVIHELAHDLQLGKSLRREVLKEIEVLEARVPGYTA